MPIEQDLREIFESVLRRVLGEELPRVLATMKPDEMLTYDEAEARFSVSVSTLKNWLQAGVITRYGTGRLTRVKASEIIAVLSSPIDRSEGSAEEFASATLTKERKK